MARGQTLLIRIGLGLYVAGLASGWSGGGLAWAQTPVGTAFSYQGRLTDGGTPASGVYDVRFTLFDAASGNGAIGAPVVVDDVTVTSGVFTVMLDFGAGAFAGDARWLEIAVRSGASTGAFTPLAARQMVTPAPHAMFASVAGAAPWTGIAGRPAGFADNVDNDTLATLACAPDQVAKWNGSAWACALAVRIVDFPASPATIGGSSLNTAAFAGATIGGGGGSTVGERNIVNAQFGTIGGGKTNEARQLAVVGGGSDNHALGVHSTIAGGSGNDAEGQYAAIAGGSFNGALGYASFSTGYGSKANGDYSFAAGYGALAGPGSFVWSDASVITGTASSADNQFIVRANGGFGVQASAGIWFGGSSTTGFMAGRFINTSTGAYLTNGGTWTNASDRNLKERFEPIDGARLLDQLAHLPITSWSYKAEPSVRHIGPMAQDFQAVFAVGDSDKAISTIDPAGIALATIQELHRRIETQDAQIKAQDARIAALEALVRQLHAQSEKDQR